jgi:hypothetical protein
MQLIHNDSYKNPWRIFYAFVVLYSAFMMYLCYELNIWVDEAYTLDTTSAKYSLSKVIYQSYNFESQPPLYFILLWLWRQINQGIFFARVYSLISVGLSAWYFFKCIRIFSGTEISKWLVVLFLVNPFTVFAALEIRLYAFLLFLSTAAIYHYLRYFIDNKKENLFYFLGICLVGLYLQYFFAFLICGLVAATLVFSGWKKVFTISLYILPVVLLFLPNVLYMQQQLGMVQTHLNIVTPAQRINLVLHSPQNLLLSLETLQTNKWLRLGLLIAFVATLAYGFYKAYKTNNTSANQKYFTIIKFCLIAVLTIVIIIAGFITIAGIDHQDRYFTIALPLLLLIFGLFGANSILIGRTFFALFILYYGILFVYHYKDPVKQFDYKGVAQYVQKTAKPTEPLLFYHGTLILPFQYYYNGNNKCYSLPHTVAMDTSYMNNVKDTSELKTSLASIESNTSSYLLISDLNLPIYKNDVNRKMVNDYLKTNYKITLDTLYYGKSFTRSLRIRRLEKK